MKSTMVEFTEAFEVKLGDARSQAAVMVIAPGQAEGGPDNRHRGADQWLYVVSGSGEAIVERRYVRPRAGHADADRAWRSTRDSKHRGRTPCHAQLFVPPAYANDGSELPAGRSS